MEHTDNSFRIQKIHSTCFVVRDPIKKVQNSGLLVWYELARSSIVGWLCVQGGKSQSARRGLCWIEWAGAKWWGQNWSFKRSGHPVDISEECEGSELRMLLMLDISFHTCELRGPRRLRRLWPSAYVSQCLKRVWDGFELAKPGKCSDPLSYHSRSSLSDVWPWLQGDVHKEPTTDWKKY